MSGREMKTAVLALGKVRDGAAKAAAGARVGAQNGAEAKAQNAEAQDAKAQEAKAQEKVREYIATMAVELAELAYLSQLDALAVACDVVREIAEGNVKSHVLNVENPVRRAG